MHRMGTDLRLGFQPSQLTEPIPVKLQLPWQLSQDLKDTKVTFTLSARPYGIAPQSGQVPAPLQILICINWLPSGQVYEWTQTDYCIYGHDTSTASQPHANHCDSVKASALMSIA